MIEGDNQVAENGPEKDVGEQPGQIGPAIDKLTAKSRDSYSKIKAKHITSCYEVHRRVCKHGRLVR